MTPFYFGLSSQPLYGAYHAPNQSVATNRGIVMCYPVGHEYNRVHRLFYQMAARWSQLGFHVLRFDYSGTGDSSGSFIDASYSRWCDDLRSAVAEFQAISSVRNISLVGCRLGANIALAASDADKRINSVVCWDPILDTSQYIKQLMQLNNCMLSDPLRFLKPRSIANKFEWLGFEYSGILLQELEELQVNISDFAPESLSVCRSTDYHGDLDSFLSKPKEKQTKCTEMTLLMNSKWGKVDDIERAIKLPNFADIIADMVFS